MKESGCEEHEGGEVRLVTQRAKTPGIFTASAYHWLYYAVYPARVELIPVGQKCTSPTEAHSVLDPAENVDADSVANSNSTYEFAGVDPKQAGLLFSKTLPCMCSICRDPSSIRCAPALARAPSPPSRRCACTHVDRDMVDQRCLNRATPASGEIGNFSSCCDSCNQWYGCTCLCRGCVEHDYSTEPRQAPPRPRLRCICEHVDRDMVHQRCLYWATPHGHLCTSCNLGTGCTCLCRGCVEHDYSTDPSQCPVCTFPTTPRPMPCLSPPAPYTSYPLPLLSKHTCMLAGWEERGVRTGRTLDGGSRTR
jgi:hypothetical protein